MTSKDLSMLKDQMLHESLANHKAAAYAASINDPVLRNLAASLAARHRQRYEAMYGYLNRQ